MSDTQVPVLDHTVQQTNVWLKKLAADHHLGDRHHALSALRAVLRDLRDRLTPEQAVHLGAQLPMRAKSGMVFSARVADGFPPQYPRDALAVTKAVLDLLWQELDPGETAKVIGTLPVPLRGLWPAIARP